jgi:hypothetical protein
VTKHLRTSVAAFSAAAVVLVGCQTDDTADTTDVETETLDDGSDAETDTGMDADAEMDEETEG